MCGSEKVGVEVMFRTKEAENLCVEEAERGHMQSNKEVSVTERPRERGRKYACRCCADTCKTCFICKGL